MSPLRNGRSDNDLLRLVCSRHSRATSMPNNPPLMKLSRDEEAYLRHWMYDEVHYAEGVGPAKRLQIQHGATPAELATLIAAGIPNPADQEAAGHVPTPAVAPEWPWSGNSFQARVRDAQAILASRTARATSVTSHS
jgi:hypothetical protein